MSGITIEHNVTPVKLDAMGVDGSPICEKEAPTFDWHYDSLPGVKALKEAEVSMLFDSSQCKHFGAVLEKWPPVTFDWHYDREEICYILEGKAVITPKPGEEITIERGDLVRFPAGLDCTWQILEAIEKHYIYGQS